MNLNRRLKELSGQREVVGNLGSGWEVSVERVRETLAQIPMPAAPLEEPWELSIGSLIGSRLPPALRHVPRLAERLGAVRLSHAELAIDSTAIAWRDMIEIQARPIAEVLSSYTADGVGVAIRGMVPVPGLTRRPVQWLTDQVSEIILALSVIALDEHGDHPVPTEFVYRDRSGRTRTLGPGILATAALALPSVAACTLATARSHEVRVVLPSTRTGGFTQDFVHARAADLATVIARLRGPAGGDSASSAAEPGDPPPVVGQADDAKPSDRGR